MNGCDAYTNGYIRRVQETYPKAKLKEMFCSRDYELVFKRVGRMVNPDLEDHNALVWLGYEILTESKYLNE